MTNGWTTRVALPALVLVSLLTCGWVATADPTRGRAWDERYSLRNVEGILKSGDLRPIAPFYPSLSHLPQTAVLAVSHGLHQATGQPILAIFDANGRFTSTAFILCRWTNVLFAIASLVLTFHVGRRVFSPHVGLLAATLLAVSPWFIRSAAIYKPDPLLTLLTITAFLWALRAAERDTLGSYLLAGAGVGLATASKHTGVLSALPIVAVAAHGWKRKVSWLRLAAAGAMSFLVFMALNPYPDQLGRYIWMVSGYANWAEAQSEAVPLSPTPIYALKLLLEPAWHGPLVGSAAILGMLGMSIALVRRPMTRVSRLHQGMVVLFPISFTLFCAIINDYPKPNVLLPTMPFTGLAAAWFLDTAWRAVKRRLSARGQRWAFATAMAAVVAAIVPNVARYVYSEAVRATTLEETSRSIASAASFLGQRTLIYESAVGDLVVEHKWTDRDGDHRTTYNGSVRSLAVERLADVDPTTLDLADFEVFPRSRLRGSRREFYLDRLARQRQIVLNIEPVLFRRRGASHVVLAHPWRPVGAAVPIDWRSLDKKKSRRLKGRLPNGLRRGRAISLNLELSSRQAERCELSLGGEPITLHDYLRAEDSVMQMSERFLLTVRRQEIELQCARARLLRTPPRISVWRWNPRQQARANSASS